jgi:hypothetical protein
VVVIAIADVIAKSNINIINDTIKRIHSMGAFYLSLFLFYYSNEFYYIYKKCYKIMKNNSILIHKTAYNIAKTQEITKKQKKIKKV